MKVYSPTELQKVDWHQRPDGLADVRLRKNIEKVTVEPVDPEGDADVQWCADEQYLVKAVSKDEAEADFDALWAEAERALMSDAEKIDAAQQSADEGQEALAELGVDVAGNGASIEELYEAIAELGTLIGGE